MQQTTKSELRLPAAVTAIRMAKISRCDRNTMTNRWEWGIECPRLISDEREHRVVRLALRWLCVPRSNKTEDQTCTGQATSSGLANQEDMILGCGASVSMLIYVSFLPAHKVDVAGRELLGPIWQADDDSKLKQAIKQPIDAALQQITSQRSLWSNGKCAE